MTQFGKEMSSCEVYTQAMSHYEHAMEALKYLEKIDIEVSGFVLPKLLLSCAGDVQDQWKTWNSQQFCLDF